MDFSAHSVWKKSVPLRVKRTLRVLLIGGSTILSTSVAGQVGDLAVPVLRRVQVPARASFDPDSQRYTYTYTVTNPSANTGEIWHLGLDVRTQTPVLGSSGLTIPIGAAGFKTFDQELADVQPLDPSAGSVVIPFGQRAPAGWAGGLRRDGFASFFSNARANRIRPGAGLGGFEIISGGVPTIRNMEVEPYWIFVSARDATPEQEQTAIDTEKAIIFNILTLAPSAPMPGSYAHWNQLRDDLNQAIQLGWVPDPVFATTLVSQLASARQAQDASDGTTAKLRLQPLQDAVGQATPGQIRREARDLVLLNVQALIANTPDTPIPFEPKVTLSPQSSDLPLGALSAVTASVINLGDPTTPPVPGFPLSFQILGGPDAGRLQFDGVTGDDGKLTFSYVGQQLGTDKVNAFQGGEVPADFGTVLVNWTGGPDLVIQLFIPPVINGGPGQSIPVTEITGNIGNTPAGPSVTGYFLASNPIPVPGLDLLLDERAVPALNPGESSQSSGITLRLPDDLVPGTYFLGACADVDSAVVELNEENNCRPTQVVIALKRSSNQPPDCSKARPSVNG